MIDMATKKYSLDRITESSFESQTSQENGLQTQVYDNPSFISDDEEVSPETAERVMQNFVNRPVPLSQHPFGVHNPYKEALYGEVEGRGRRNGIDHSRILMWLAFFMAILVLCVIVIILAENSPGMTVKKLISSPFRNQSLVNS